MKQVSKIMRNYKAIWLMPLLVNGLVACASVSASRNAIVLSGKVVDSRKQPLSRVSVVISPKDLPDTVVCGALTDVAGAFACPRVSRDNPALRLEPQGHYVILFEKSGFRAYEKTLTLGKEPLSIESVLYEPYEAPEEATLDAQGSGLPEGPVKN